jgi:hypothetical protein
LGEELETGLPAGAAGFAAREGAIDARNFAKIFFNMTIEAGKRLRFVLLCNSHMPEPPTRCRRALSVTPAAPLNPRLQDDSRDPDAQIVPAACRN